MGTGAKKIGFGPDASLTDEDALRDTWYRHEEIIGKKLVDSYEPIGEEGVEKFFLRRRMKFMGQRLKQYFEKLPAEQYPEAMQEYIELVIAGEAELTEELEKVYNTVAMPT